MGNCSSIPPENQSRPKKLFDFDKEKQEFICNGTVLPLKNLKTYKIIEQTRFSEKMFFIYFFYSSKISQSYALTSQITVDYDRSHKIKSQLYRMIEENIGDTTKKLAKVINSLPRQQETTETTPSCPTENEGETSS